MLLALSVLGTSAFHNVENFVLFMHGFLTSALIHTALLTWRYLKNDLQRTILNNKIIVSLFLLKFSIRFVQTSWSMAVKIKVRKPQKQFDDAHYYNNFRPLKNLNWIG